MSKARDIADLDFNAPDIDGGNIDGAVIGATTAAASTFTDVVAASLDISGNIDVDGTTNLDVVDIDGAVDMASTLTVGDNILLEASGNPSITNKATGGGNNPTFRLQADTNYWDFQGTFSNTNDDLFFMYNGASKFSLTNAGAATFSSTVNGMTIKASASGDRFGCIPEIASNGVMEVGRYIDFHATDGDTSDYGARLDFDGTNLITAANSSLTGTLAVAGNVEFPTTQGLSYAGAKNAGLEIGTVASGGSLLVRTPSLNSSFSSGLMVDGSYSSELSQVNLTAAGVHSGGGYEGHLHLRTTSQTSIWPAITAKPNSLQLYTANTERMRILSAGTVRMSKGGTAFTPLAYDGLVIQSHDATGIRIIDAGNGGNNGGHCGIGNDNGNLQLSAAGDMMFDTGFAPTDQLYNGRNERMRINSAGHITTQYGNTSGYAQTSGSTGVAFVNDTGAIGSALVSVTNAARGWSNLYVNRIWSSGEDTRFMQFTVNGSGVCGYIRLASASTMTYGTSSDYRLKENVVYDWDATTRLKQLKPARFNFIADGTDVTQDGFMAHEAQEVVPIAVSGTKDAMKDEDYEITPAVLDDNGVEIEAAVMGTRRAIDAQGIDHSLLVPLLVKTIQELEARITILEAGGE